MEDNRNNEKHYRVKILRNIEELEQIRSIWENLAWHPNSDMDFYLTILKERPNILYPCIFLLLSNNIIEGMLVAKVEQRELRIGTRSKTFWTPKVRSLTVINGGFLGKCTRFGYEILLDNLLLKLKQKEVDIVFFPALQKDSYLLHLAKTKPNFLCRDHFITYQKHWRICLPNTYREFLDKIGHHRLREIKRQARVLERQFPGDVVYECFNRLENLDKICEDLEIVASKTYQRVLDEGFVNNKLWRSRLKLSAEKEWLRIYVLYVEKKPWVFWIGTKYGNLFYLDCTGYELRYKKYGPGTVLFFKMIEDLINIGVSEIDFGLGDSSYKHVFGDRYWDECSILIFASKGKTIFMNIIKSCANLLSILGGNIFGRLKMGEKRTRRWRAKLLNKTSI